MDFTPDYSGYSAYPLAAQQFKLQKDWDIFITQVIGLIIDNIEGAGYDLALWVAY